MIKRFLLYIILLFPLIIGCSEKFDINQLGNTKGSTNISGDTVYVHINPDWGGFNNPRAILVGKEPFIYVCDTDNDRIVMLNTAGTVLGYLNIKKPIAITEDYRLNLIVCAQVDTGAISYSAVYKIDLYAVNHIIANATKKLILPRKVDIDLHPTCVYTAVTAFYDNSYDIARTGTNNTSIYDPDNAILKFQYVNPDSDAYASTVNDVDALSSGLITANGINSMISFSKKKEHVDKDYSIHYSFFCKRFFIIQLR